MSEELESRGKVDPVDTYVGKRLKMRRIMLGLSQHDLGNAVNVSIQQIQKYEKATNRISCGRLYAFAKLLMVPIDFFFSDAESAAATSALNDERDKFDVEDQIAEKELLTLVKSYSSIKDPVVRKKLADLIKTIAEQGN